MPRVPTSAVALLLVALGNSISIAAADQSLRGTFLVADAGLSGTLFERSVVLLLNHTADGAQGLIVNRPTRTTLAEVLPERMADGEHDYTLHLGGPVQPHRLALLSRTAGDETEPDEVIPGVTFIAFEEAIDAILAERPEPDTLRAFTGYAGWGPGQLEHEIERGDWHIVPADSEAVFTDAPDRLWRKLYERIRGPQRIRPEHSI